MVGVANPMLRWDRANGIRFLAGYALGRGVSAVALYAVLMVIIEFLGLVTSQTMRIALALILLPLLGFADLVNRVPQTCRQTPQRFSQIVTPGWRGFFYGIDIGLLVTTRKVTSLTWAALLGVLLVSPGAVPLLLATLFAIDVCVVVLGSAWGRPIEWSVRSLIMCQRVSRALAGVAIIALPLPVALVQHAT